MRKNFYELLAQKEFNIKKEYDTLWELLFEEKSVLIGSYLKPLYIYIDASYFRSLSFRGSCTNISALMKAIGLEKYIIIDIEKLLLFCEFLIALLPEREIIKNIGANKQGKTILGNVHYILEQTNHECVVNEENNPIVVEKNKNAKLASELIEDNAIAFDIIEYNHFALKGHLVDKKKILVSIANYIEPILKSKVLSKSGYKQLESDAGFIFNNFHIRHNNKEGAKAQDYIISISDTELEEWYDKAYEIALSVIIISAYIKDSKKIEDLKSNYTWRT